MYICIFSEEPAMPMIPLGLKETKDIDFQDPFKVSVYMKVILFHSSGGISKLLSQQISSFFDFTT